MAETFFDKIYKNKTAHTPDVLSCLANLSNDEVFTPPDVVNQMLDMLPQKLFCDPTTTFLDPACKTGVFLREIAKRLIVGLADEIPNLQQRIDHIFHKQLYGIAITELTSLLSRRSLYCSKYPNSQYSVSHFDDAEGNIRYRRIEHKWGKCTVDAKGKQRATCLFCGASSEQWDRTKDLETHAYEFIHIDNPNDILNMKFDVIISNPPYQMNDGGGMGASAIPLYHKFVLQARKLNPRYISMIIPSRWFVGGKGLDSFRNEMLHDNRIRVIHDFIASTDCFSGVEIKGGVCYFLWERDNRGDCHVCTHLFGQISEMERPLLENNSDVFIRYNKAISIINKIDHTHSFSCLVSSRNPFGYSSGFSCYSLKNNGNPKIYLMNQKCGWINEGNVVEKNVELLNKWKVLVSKAVGVGNMSTDIIKPFIAEPGAVCSETYLAIGPFDDRVTAENVMSYMETKFFHFLLGLKKITQNSTKDSYSFIPLLDFSRKWSDGDLYQKYNLNSDEISYIESSIWSFGEEV